MTILTSVTGFMFPISGFTPALGVGVISLLVLSIALLALYGKHLDGSLALDLRGRRPHGAMVQRFVLIVQAFEKVPLLHPLAPSADHEPPFLIAQTRCAGDFRRARPYRGI